MVKYYADRASTPGTHMTLPTAEASMLVLSIWLTGLLMA
jgi:hypothetical protein